MPQDEELTRMLKDKGFVTKEDLIGLRQDAGKDPNMVNVNEVIDHMNSCTADDCGIHKNIASKESIAVKKGFILGYGYGRKSK